MMWTAADRVNGSDRELTGTQQIGQLLALLRVQHVVRFLERGQHLVFESLCSRDAELESLLGRMGVEGVAVHRIRDSRDALLLVEARLGALGFQNVQDASQDVDLVVVEIEAMRHVPKGSSNPKA